MRVTIVKDKHLNELIKFLSTFENENRGKKFWKERLNHWWNNNPNHSKNHQRGWILFNQKENIVGFLGNIPIPFVINGNIELTNNATTWRVLEKYRSHSIALFDKLNEYSSKAVLFETTPTLSVEKILSIYYKFDKLEVSKATVIPIKIAENSTNKYLNKIKPLIPLLNTFIPIFNKVFISHPKHLESKIISTNEISTYFDDLWEKTKQNYSNTLLRNSKTIKWYFDNQFSCKKVLICCFKDKEMIGYGIFSIRANVMFLIDFWSTSMKLGTLKSIANEAFYYGNNNNIRWLYFIHFNNHIKKMFKKLYPYKRSYDSKLYYKTKICDLESSDSFTSLILGDLGL